MNSKSALLFATILGFASHLPAVIIGTNIPASPLTIERISALPASQQAAWKNYLDRSVRQMQADRDFLQAEMKTNAPEKIKLPPAGSSVKGIALDKPAEWYGEAEGRRIANIIVSFQTPAGGWSKNLNMTRFARMPGESFTGENIPARQENSDNDLPQDRHWSYVGTFDNGATITQLRFLAKVIAATGTNSSGYRSAFQHGLDYIFAAQFPNGGWPQVWPLQGGYHDAITYNDDAMLNVMGLLRDVAAGQNEFNFVPAMDRDRAVAGLKRGVDCILATQIIVNGRRTVWGQQHDTLTLQPTSARNYEMPSQASSESITIVLFLMQMPNPDAKIVAAVHAAAAWFEKTKIEGEAYKPVPGQGRRLIDAPGKGPLWARYYEIGSDRPIFGDRDKSIHDDVNEISLERRNGYGWFRDTPKRLLEHYVRWSKAHP